MAKLASAETLAIRKLLDDTKGEITFNDAQPILLAQGFDLRINEEGGAKKARKRFDIGKFHWRKANVAKKGSKKVAKPAKAAKVVKTKGKPGPKPKVAAAVAVAPKFAAPQVNVDLNTALQFIENNGGVAKVQQMVDTVKALSARVQKAAS